MAREITRGRREPARRVGRYGALVVFAAGVTRQEAEAAIARLRDVVDPEYQGETIFKDGQVEFETRPLPTVQEFDPEMGGPVWYIP